MQPATQAFTPYPIPVSAGIGLRGDHYEELSRTLPRLGFLEIHSENYFGRGGTPHRYLLRLREEYPLSFHGVGLSLGSCDALDNDHLQRLQELIDLYQPDLVSEHLSWSSIGGKYLNDLLPLPYTESALVHLVRKISQVQEKLGRQILLENVSSYLEFQESDIPEWEFIAEVSNRTGCGILLDVNNIYVNSQNHGFTPELFIAAIPASAVKEIHLAGHTVNQFEDGNILIDTHNQLVAAPVWELYRQTIARLGGRPTLIEWDTDLPPLSVLLQEAMHAQTIIDENRHARVA